MSRDGRGGAPPGPRVFAGRYEVTDELGAGGMGLVHRVIDRPTGAVLALKTMSHYDGETLARFKDEFRAVADIRHPNLVRLGELVEDAGQVFFTMEFVDGVPWLTWVRPPFDGDATPAAHRARFDEDRLRHTLHQLALGLDALHAGDRVHRDVKPSNVLVTAAGRAVLLDFGLSVRTVAGRQRSDVLPAGTALYMAPEQAAGQPVDARADWYSVGVMLFEALTGRPPFDGELLEMLARKMAEEAPRPADLVPGLPDDLCALCSDLLRRDVRRRPRGAEIVRRLAPGGAARPAATATAGALVGRRREKDALAEAAADARGGAVLQLIVGDSGIGKSALVGALGRELAEGDAVVLAGRVHEREALVFKAIDGVVDALGRRLAKLDAAQLDALLPRRPGLVGHLFPSLCRLEPVREAAAAITRFDDPRAARTAAFAAFRELVARVAEKWRLVVIIDDFHRTDADSVDLLSHLLRGPDAPRALFVLTARRSPVIARLTTLAERDLLPAPRVLELGPLEPGSARELARLATAGRADGGDALIDAIVDASRGHPGFLLALARADAAPAAGGRSLDDLLWARIAALPASARELLGVISAAASPLALGEVADVVGRNLADLDADLDRLSEHDLVSITARRADGVVEPYHDRVAETLLARAAADDVARWHRGLATALEAGGGADPERLLRHWQAAGELAPLGRLAAAAAARAAAALELHRAADLYRLALDRGDATAPPWQLRAALGDVLADAGDGRAAADAFLAAAAEPDAPDVLDLQRRAADQLLLAGDVARAMGLLDAVLAAVGAPPPAGRITTLARLAWARLRVGRRLGRGDRPARAPTALERRRLDAYWSAGQGLSTIDTLRGYEYQARFLALALELGDDSRRSRGLSLEAAYLATGGEPARPRVEARLAEAAALAERSGAPIDRGWVALARAVGGVVLGDFTIARAAADEAQGWFAARGSRAIWEQRSARTFGIIAAYFAGDVGSFAARTRAALADAWAHHDVFTLAQLRVGAGNSVWLLADDPATALAEAEAARASWQAPSYQVPTFYHLVATTQAHLYAGDGARAHAAVEAGWRGLARSLLLRVHFLQIDAWYLRGRAAVACAAGLAADDPARARLVAEAMRAVREMRRPDAPWGRAVAHLVLAGAAAVRGDRAAAIDALTRADLEADAHGMAMMAAAARRGLAAQTGDAAHVARAARDDDRLRALGVARPDRWLDLFAPGVAPRR